MEFIFALIVISIIIFVCAKISCLKSDLEDAQVKIRKLSEAEKELNRIKALERNVAAVFTENAQKKKTALERNIEALERDSAKLKKVISEMEAKHAKLLMDEASFETFRHSTKMLPYFASIIADFDTRGIEILARQLEWGDNQERKKKVASLRLIRKEAKEKIAQYKLAQYQLDYAIKMFPALEDFLDTDYDAIQEMVFNELPDDGHDESRHFLSKDEYHELSVAERNQLALDRYLESYKKSKWQIGRDYELYIGYRYEKKGYKVNYFGSVNKLEDLGRDLIAQKDDGILIIQCKYWASHKEIHEKHIAQLYGTVMCYCFEHNLPTDFVHGVLVTNIYVSDTARRFAHFLGIELAENIPCGTFPRIKCNINRSHDEGTTKIYHLPFDQMYDACQITQPGEFMAMTVAEAEAAGFRRAYRWHGNQ